MEERQNIPKSDAQLTQRFASGQDVAAYQQLVALLDQCPIPPGEILANLALFLTRSELSRILFMHNLYQRILPVSGVIIEFGVRWGRNIALWATCSTMYEPYNPSRRIVGFDTFEGFPSVSPQDGQSEMVGKGLLSVTAGYEEYLQQLLSTHQQLSAQSHVRRCELVKGDVLETLPDYLERHPELIVALAYFDVDLYEPTKKALELIEPYLTKGSVVAFDELVLPDYPGETQALRESYGLGKYRLQRDPTSGYRSFMVIE